MKVLVLLFAIACVAVAVPVEQILGGYPRFIDFPDGDGNLHKVDLLEEPDSDFDEVARNPENNLYLLYTRRNPSNAQTLVNNDANSIRNSNFNPNAPTLVVVHGWLSNQNTDLNPVIRDAVLGRSDTNVIVLDWRRLARRNYVTAVSGVPAVGRGLGQFLNFLFQVTGARFEQLHLAGFSLGGHVVGNAGRELGGRASRVTGLDPAGPLWVYNRDRINSNDARYVEAIHTDGNYAIGLGIGSNVGNVDFYPNGGSNQPGCLTGICDHNRAWELFAASITHRHLIGYECTSSTQITINTCRGRQFPLGNDDLNKYGSGVFRVNTDRRYPY